MNFGGLLENIDPALFQQIMASIQPASDPRLQITVPANQHETNMPQQWPPPNAQQAFSGMPEQAQVGILNQPRPQMPQPQMPQPQQAEQRPRAEALPEPKPEYTPPTPGILGKPMPATLPKDPYEFDFKKNWPLLLMQFANGMGRGNMGRTKGQRVWGALAGGATGAGNYLQQYPQQKMQEALLKGKVDEVTQKTNVQAAFNEYLNNPNITPEQKRMAQFLGPEKWAEKNMAATPSGFNRDEKGNLSVDPGYAAYNLTKAKVGATQVINHLPGNPRPQTKFEQLMDEDMAKTASDFAARARSARDQLTALDAMDKILPNITTGPGTETMAEIKKIGQMFGINMDELGLKNNVPGVEAMGALSNTNALRKVEQMKGALSDKDVAFVRSMGPSLQTSTEGNKALIQINRLLAQREIDTQNIMQAYIRKHGTLNPTGAPSFQEFITVWSDKNPLFENFKLPTMQAPVQQQRPLPFVPGKGIVQ